MVAAVLAVTPTPKSDPVETGITDSVLELWWMPNRFPEESNSIGPRNAVPDARVVSEFAVTDVPKMVLLADARTEMRPELSLM